MTITQRVVYRLPSSIPNTFNLLLSRLRDSSFIAHHGIQRSGTNYLRYCLKGCGFYPLNAHDPARTSPKHKHFRWYADKSLIPLFIEHQYGNNITADDVFQINKIASFPKDCRHIVVQKNEYDWLASISNWGLRCGWFDSKENAVNNLKQSQMDYTSYYGFWNEIASANPNRVVIIKLEKLQSDFNFFKEALEAIGFDCSAASEFHGKVDEVPMSPKGRAKLVVREDVIDMLG